MINGKLNLNKFQSYKDNAIEDCKKLSFTEKAKGLWSEPEIIDYFSRIFSEEPIEQLALSLKYLLPDLNNRKVICIGGGTGKLGRRIATLYPKIYVTEVDSSKEMVCEANKLALKEDLNDRFISIVADAKSLPFNINEYDYAIAYGIFRYLDSAEQKEVLSEISRITSYGFTVAESITKELIYNLKNELKDKLSSIIETNVSMFRVSLFYMLFKEYKRNENFREMVNNETTNTLDFIEILICIAGTTKGTLYELRISNLLS